MGSTREVRWAGTKPAARPTITSSSRRDAEGQRIERADADEKRPERRRQSQRCGAANRDTGRDQAEGSGPEPPVLIRPADAPSAIRIPTSTVREAATYAITPYSPIIASRSPTIPIDPISNVPARRIVNSRLAAPRNVCTLDRDRPVNALDGPPDRGDHALGRHRTSGCAR